MGFREGWYLIRTDHQERNFCRYFNTPTTYTAECIVEPNGEQILLWQASEGSPAKQGQWSSDYTALQQAPAGDWWDNPKTSAGYNPDIPGDYSRKDRKPSARELCQRAGHADPAAADGLSCSKEIHVSVFFDGTNNNMVRDRPDSGHSNIVSLFDAHRDDKKDYFAYYIPGVGTEFQQIKEFGESSDGKAFASGGENRIHWAMLLVYNAVCRAATGADLMQESEMTPLVTDYFGLHTKWRLGDDKMILIFRLIDARLRKALEGKRPTILRVNLSVFGFSRGAAEARTFCNWLQRATGGRVGTATVRLRFLGLFDTVASVGLADSSPIGNGLMDWADGTMEIPSVESGVHYVATHEIRRSFPLSTARSSGGTATPNMREYIYPGAHSDIGGGYSPKDQGKSLAGRSQMLSQITLNDMHFEALNAGVEMRRLNQMPLEVRTDFLIEDTLNMSFSDYAAWTTKAEEKTENVAASSKAFMEGRMHYHMQLYWRWRASKTSDIQFKALSSYSNASKQDQQDLWESEGDWRQDVALAQRAHLPRKRMIGTRFGVREVEEPPSPSDVQKAIVLAIDDAASVTPAVDAFFDRYVHDSHAGFWLLGPQTQYDKKVYIAEIKRKVEKQKEMLAAARESVSAEAVAAYEAEAQRYALNNFERLVLESDRQSTNSMPLMSDADAADMRDNQGLKTSLILKYVLGTGTRREANGHGQYRRLFDKS